MALSPNKMVFTPIKWHKQVKIIRIPRKYNNILNKCSGAYAYSYNYIYGTDSFVGSKASMPMAYGDDIELPANFARVLRVL